MFCLCLCLCPCIRLCVRLCRCLGHHQMNPDAVLLPAIYDMWVAMLKSHKCGCLLRIRLQREEGEEGEGEGGKSHSKVGSRWVRQTRDIPMFRASPLISKVSSSYWNGMEFLKLLWLAVHTQSPAPSTRHHLKGHFIRYNCYTWAPIKQIFEGLL